MKQKVLSQKEKKKQPLNSWHQEPSENSDQDFLQVQQLSQILSFRKSRAIPQLTPLDTVGSKQDRT